MNGVVIKSTGKTYLVKTVSGDILRCGLKGKFRVKGIQSTNPIVVGDKVELEEDSGALMIVKLGNQCQEEECKCLIYKHTTLKL